MIMKFDKIINDLENEIFDDDFIIRTGSIPILFTAPHTMEQKRADGSIKYREVYTKSIALYLNKYFDVNCMIKIKDTGLDANIDNHDEFKSELIKFVKNNNIKIVIDLHGSKKEREYDVEFGTLNNLTADYSVIKELEEAFLENGIKNIIHNDPFKGGAITQYLYNLKDVDVVQLEINYNYRDYSNIDNLKLLCDSLSKFIIQYNDYTNRDSNLIRESVKKDYDLVASEYCSEYGNEIGDVQFIEEFKKYLAPNSTIVDLGGGNGVLTKYLLDNNYDCICYDFSYEMKKQSFNYFGEIPYILDDMINIKNHFSNNSLDGLIAMYSLFHIPKSNMKTLLLNIYDVLKEDGIFSLVFKMGNGEKYVDEVYLGEEGCNRLYINYYEEDEIIKLINDCNYKIVYKDRKNELGDNVIGDNDTLYLIIKK